MTVVIFIILLYLTKDAIYRRQNQIFELYYALVSTTWLRWCVSSPCVVYSYWFHDENAENATKIVGERETQNGSKSSSFRWCKNISGCTHPHRILCTLLELYIIHIHIYIYSVTLDFWPIQHWFFRNKKNYFLFFLFLKEIFCFFLSHIYVGR